MNKRMYMYIKNIYDEPQDFIYKLRNGLIVMPVKDYDNQNKLRGYKLIDFNLIFDAKQDTKWYSFRDRVVDLDDYEFYNREDYEPIKLKYHESYINDGKDYEIIAYKYCRTKQIALNSLCNPNDIIWTWIAKDYETN